MNDKQIDWADFEFNESLVSKFRDFHEENPEILGEIVMRARALKQRGHIRCGIGMIFEVMRWDHMLRTTTNEPFKLNNNYRACYTRLIEQRHRDLVGFFSKRSSVSDGENLAA